MPRYIDADKLIELATHEGAYGYVDVYDIDSIPTADVVEIVRCKDCKMFDDEELAAGKKKCFCYFHGANFSLDYFCARGERRKNR